MKHLFPYIIIAVVSCSAIVISLVNTYRQPKIGYINSSLLLSEYKGTRDAKKFYDRKLAEWQSEMDTLVSRYERDLNSFRLSSESMEKKEKELKMVELRNKEQDLINRKKELQAKAAEEDRAMMEGVIKQVNDQLREYGTRYGYDYIFGATAEGNLLYARQGDDITIDVLEVINRE